uniref:Uncharacterized protein n=1 Tax=Caenorhabditis japonica TaxID=281687 RepID=A0A8R1J0U4_CAEJA
MGEPTDKQAIGMSPENPIDETALEPTDAGHENQQPQPNDQQDHNGEMVQQVVIDSSDDEENIDQEAEETASRAKSPMTTEESAETATAEALGEILGKYL